MKQNDDSMLTKLEKELFEELEDFFEEIKTESMRNEDRKKESKNSPKNSTLTLEGSDDEEDFDLIEEQPKKVTTITNQSRANRTSNANSINNWQQLQRQERQLRQAHQQRHRQAQTKMNSKQTKKSGTTPSHQDEEDEEEEEEEDFDIDVHDCDSFPRNAFEIDATLTKSLQFLNIKELIVFRRINKHFYNLLNFSFSMNDCQLDFNYNSKFLKRMIERDLLYNNNISTLGKWYLQTINIQHDCIMVKPQLFDDDDNNNNNDSKSFRTTDKNDSSYLKSMQLCKISICDENNMLKKTHLKGLDENIDKNGNCTDCKVLRRAYKQAKCIDTQMKQEKNLYMSYELINDLLLGYIFEISLFKEKFLLILSENNCRHFRIGFYFDLSDESHEPFIHVTRQLGMYPPLSSQGTKVGFQSLLCYTALKGDFTLYHNFLRDEFDNDESKIVQSGRILDGIFSLGCLFLRHDIIDSYIHYNHIRDGLLEEPICCLLFLLNPDFLTQYKLCASNVVGIPLSEKELFEMDIKNNDRYCPYNRLSLIKKLCFSSIFNISWRQASFVAHPTFAQRYIQLRKMVHKLYYNFDFFQRQWHLTEYSNFENDLKKQKKFHQDFQIIIQTLFGFGCWFQDFSCGYPQSIIQSRNNINIMNDKHKFIDVKIENETQLRQFYDIMRQGDSNEQVCHLLANPLADGRWCEKYPNKNVDQIGQPLIFPPVTDAYGFLYSMWKIDCIDNSQRMETCHDYS